MGELMIVTAFLLGFFMAVMADACLKLALPLARLEAQKASIRTLTARLEASNELLEDLGSRYAEAADYASACACDCALKLRLPPPPQPGFAARRKGEGRNA